MKPKAVLLHIFRSGIVARLPSNLPLQSILTVSDALLASPVLSVQLPWQAEQTPPLIQDLKKRAGENMVVGVSGIETADQVTAAIEAGAQFLMTPRYDRLLAIQSQAAQVLLIPSIISIVAANAAYQNGIRLISMQTGGPQGVDYIAMVLKSIPGLNVAVGGDYVADEATAYAKAGASALFVEQAIYEGSEQTMADVITRARQLQIAWDKGMKARSKRPFSQNAPTKTFLN